MLYIIGLGLKELNSFIQKLYKLGITNIYRMFPSDHIGSLDDFFLKNFVEVYNGRNFSFY